MLFPLPGRHCAGEPLPAADLGADLAVDAGAAAAREQAVHHRGAL